MSAADKIALIGHIIASAALLIAAVSLIIQMRSSAKQTQLQNFIEYTRRYQEILLNLPIGISRPDYDLNAQDETQKQNALKYLRAYFDLCAEEYWLDSHGYFEKEIWQLWRNAMKSKMQKKAFKDAWDTFRNDIHHYDKKFVGFVGGLK